MKLTIGPIFLSIVLTNDYNAHLLSFYGGIFALTYRIDFRVWWKV